MRISDVQLGIPAILYKNTKDNIETMDSLEGMYAYATDIQKFGYYTTISGWVWQTEVPAGISSITVENSTTTISGVTTVRFNGASVESLGESTALVTITTSGIVSSGVSTDFDIPYIMDGFVNGSIAVASGILQFISPIAATIKTVKIGLENQISGTTLVDVNKNGTSILQTPIHLTSTGVDSASVNVAISANDIISVDIDQIGADTRDLSVVIYATYTLSTTITSTDSTAIHRNASAEINLLTEKSTLADNDIFIVEDSADSFNKKKVKKSSLSSNSIKQQAILTFAGELITGRNPLRIYNTTGETKTLLQVQLSADTAPTGSGIIVDIHKDETTIFTTQNNRPQISGGSNLGVSTLLDVTSWGNGEYLTAEIDQIGSTVKGANLVVNILFQ